MTYLKDMALYLDKSAKCNFFCVCIIAPMHIYNYFIELVHIFLSHVFSCARRISLVTIARTHGQGHTAQRKYGHLGLLIPETLHMSLLHVVFDFAINSDCFIIVLIWHPMWFYCSVLVLGFSVVIDEFLSLYSAILSSLSFMLILMCFLGFYFGT